MCDYCQKELQLLTCEIPTEIWGQLSGYTELQIIIDRGYLRLGQTDDMQCLDNGGKLRIKYCPMCGKMLD